MQLLSAVLAVLAVSAVLVSSAVFQLFVLFSGFIASNFASIQQSSRIFIGGRIAGVPAATGG